MRVFVVVGEPPGQVVCGVQMGQCQGFESLVMMFQGLASLPASYTQERGRLFPKRCNALGIRKAVLQPARRSEKCNARRTGCGTAGLVLVIVRRPSLALANVRDGLLTLYFGVIGVVFGARRASR